MKTGEAIIVISLLGTISQAAKLLKVPRIYNALITSDKELLPSQAFPALSPVLQSIHFPHFANTLYQPIGVPIMNRNSDFSINDQKSLDKSTNQVFYDNYAKNSPGIPLNKNDFQSSNPSLPKSAPVLFRPNLESRKNDEENMPNIIPNSNFKGNTVDAMKPFYPHYDDEIGQIFDIINYDNKKVYSASSPTSSSSNLPTTQKNVPDVGSQFPFGQFSKNLPSVSPSSPNNYQLPDIQQQDESRFSNSPNNPNYVDSSSQPIINQFPDNYGLIKNNGPKDSSIADVPPPPLPVGKPIPQRRNPSVPETPAWTLES